MWDVSAIAQRLFLLSVLFFWVPRLPLSGTAAKPSEDKPVAKRARKKDSAIDSFAKLAAAYGHPSLRGFQQTAISGVVEGKHVVMVVGVGGGKTLPLEASIFHAQTWVAATVRRRHWCSWGRLTMSWPRLPGK